MSDLRDVLPDFNTKPYTHLLHSLEKNDISVTDLVSLDPVEIARKCPLPLLDLRRLVTDVVYALQKDLNMLDLKQSTSSDLLASTNDRKPAPRPSLGHDLTFVKTLDPAIDKLLGGGLPIGYITEVVGER
jgi:DNA repair protein RAD57